MTPWTAAHQDSLSLTISQFAQVHVHWITFFVTFLSFCLQSSPASGYFPVSWLLASGGQSTGASASASVLPMTIHGWFSLRLTSLISLQSKGLSRVWHHILKGSLLQHSAFLMVHFSHLYITPGKTIALTIQTFVGKWCFCFPIHYQGLS